MDVPHSELPSAFISLFMENIGLNDAEFDYLLTHFRKEHLPKRFNLVAPGQVTRYKTYIQKGCTRTFMVDDDGREHILFFAFEDWWIGDIESYNTGQPGTQYVQAIEDCELLCISKIDFDKLEKEIPKLYQWYHLKQQRHLFAMLQRLREVKTMTPEQRYQNLLDKYPAVFQRVPLQYIAQYLDIEPPSLSRLRKRLSEK